MQDHAWELGIDWEVQNDFDGRPYLQNGFTRVGGRNGLAAHAKAGQIQRSSKVRFVVFDTTPEEFRRHTTESITSVVVEFRGLYDRGRNPNQRDSPVAEGTRVELQTSFQGNDGFAWYYGDNLPTWTCSPNLEIVNDGRYLMKVTVAARATNGDTKTWIVDPEMLIGPG